MRRLFMAFLLLACIAVPARAESLILPPGPETGDPSDPAGAIQRIWEGGLSEVRELLPKAVSTCMGALGLSMAAALVSGISGQGGQAVEKVTMGAVSSLFLSDSGDLMALGRDTVLSLTEYGKLLLPVLTAALAAQGYGGTSAAQYALTAFFLTGMGNLLTRVFLPLVYVYLALSIGHALTGEKLLKNMKKSEISLLSWVLKGVLMVFTGVMGITNVICGAADGAALKAAKTLFSTMIPVVGSILSDASETVLAGAAVVKNTLGIGGILAVLSLSAGPFFRIGIRYLMWKLTAAICSIFVGEKTGELMEDFSSAMGLLLGITGAVCMMLLIGCACFLKGAG